MEKKKSNKAELETKRKLFLQLGFIITLALIIMAFEWSTEESETLILSNNGNIEIEEDLDNIIQKDIKLIKPIPKLQLTDVINMVTDDVIIDDDLEFSSEDDQDNKMEVNFTLDDEEGDNTPFILVENMPIFRPKINTTEEEGKIDLHRFVAKQVKYPKMAVEANLQGKVYVTFVVNKKGEVTDVKVARGDYPILNNEAIRVVKNLPKFSPGKQRGKAVNVQYNVAINFKLS